MICICGHASEDHEDGTGECTICGDCEMFKASTGDPDGYRPEDWGDE